MKVTIGTFTLGAALLALALASGVWADNLWWGGDVDQDWNTIGNWTTGSPGPGQPSTGDLPNLAAGDKAIAYAAEEPNALNINTNAETYQLNLDNGTINLNAGTLTASLGGIWLQNGVNNFVMNGGAINVINNGNMIIGHNPGNNPSQFSTFDMHDGTVDISRRLALPSGSGTAHGRVNLYGGTMTALEAEMTTSRDGVMNIAGGTLIVKNVTVGGETMADLAAADKLVSYGRVDDEFLIITIDAGIATITAVPPPRGTVISVH